MYTRLHQHQQLQLYSSSTIPVEENGVQAQGNRLRSAAGAALAFFL
jgi:hypothetical protein